MAESVIHSINKQLKAFDLMAETTIALKENEEAIVILNKDQLSEGKTAIGDTRTYRSLSYWQMKSDMPLYRAPNQRVDWNLTGAFYKGFHIVIKGNEWNIDSTDEKTNDIISDQGEEVFGLNPDSLEIAQSYIEHDLAKKIKKIFE